MSKNKNIIILLSLILLLLTGCKMIDQAIPLEYENTQSSHQRTADQNKKMQARFGQKDEQELDAVERTLLWSKRYEEASARNEELTRKNNAFQIENNEIKNKLASMQNELDAAKWELSEANEFMQEMQLELTKWKGDVLGFRDEMRDAQVAQLNALRKIMKILGAEMTEPVKLQTEDNQVETK